MAGTRTTYIPSGRYEKAGLIGLPCVIVLTAPLAMTPVVLTWWLTGMNPISMSFGPFVIGYIVIPIASILAARFAWIAIKRWKMRCPVVAAALAIPSAIVGAFLAAALWYGAIYDNANIEFINGRLSPAKYVGKLIENRVRLNAGQIENKNDPYTGSNMTGWHIASFIAEMCFYVVWVAMMTYLLARLPFSERSNQWMKFVPLRRRAVVSYPPYELYEFLSPEHMEPFVRASGEKRKSMALALFLDPVQENSSFLFAYWGWFLPVGAILSGYRKKMMKIDSMQTADVFARFGTEECRGFRRLSILFSALGFDLDSRNASRNEKKSAAAYQPHSAQFVDEQPVEENASLVPAKIYVPSGRYEAWGVYILPLSVFFASLLQQTMLPLYSPGDEYHLYGMEMFIAAIIAFVVAVYAVHQCKMRNPELARRLSIGAYVAALTLSAYIRYVGDILVFALNLSIILPMCLFFLREMIQSAAAKPFSEKSRTWLSVTQLPTLGVCRSSKRHPITLRFEDMQPAPDKSGASSWVFFKLSLFQDVVADGEHYIRAQCFRRMGKKRSRFVYAKFISVSFDQIQEVVHKFGPAKKSSFWVTFREPWICDNYFPF